MVVRERRETGVAKPYVFNLDRVPTPLGDLVVLTDDQHRVRAAEFWDLQPRMHRLLRRYYGPLVTLQPGHAPSELRERVAAYFEGTFGAIDEIVTETAGSTFQRAVWAALRRIPPGKTLTYRELAAEVGRPRAVRAVGHANGANPICVIVPCHRIVGARNDLRGYGGGLMRKHWLLVHEGALPPDTPLPRTRSRL